MKRTLKHGLLSATLLICGLADHALTAVAAQEPPTPGTAPSPPPPATLRLTLDELKERVLLNNKLLALAAQNVQSKGYATRAMQANYFPQILGQLYYFHFNDNLGQVVTLGGRTLTGPRGVPLGTLPTAAFAVPLIEQDSEVASVMIVQPITDLLKVRQGVNLARADEQIAQAELEKGTRELASGVEQLFWGLLASQRIRAGTEVAVAGAEALAKTGNLEARTALVQARQGLQQVDKQIADLMVQLTILLEVPPCTKVELVEPPLPVAPLQCADEAVQFALASSPEIREAEQNIAKAHAAVAAAKVDRLPNIAVVGGYANNNLLDVVQTNIGYVGVVGSYTFVDWGKRRNTIRERDQLVGMATLKLQQTRDDVRQKALLAYGEYKATEQALQLAGELQAVRQEAAKNAADPAAQFKAAKDLMEAQVDAVKADLAHRIAYVKLMAIIGKL